MTKRPPRTERKRLYAAYDILKHLFAHKPNPQFAELNRKQQDWVIREFCAAKVAEYSARHRRSQILPHRRPAARL